MKKKYILLAMIIFVFTTLVGCGTFEEAGLSISSPQPGKTIINGTWQITKFEVLDERLAQNEEAEKLVNQKVSVDIKVTKIGDKYFSTPKYKLKVLNSKDYFLYEHKKDINNYEIEDKEMDIVSISDNNNGVCDFILDTNSKGYLYYNGVLYWVNKTSDKSEQIDKSYIEAKPKESLNLPQNSNYDDYTGILLGLKSKRKQWEDGSFTANKYRTLWINNLSGGIDCKEKTGLLVPRISGFWEVDIEDIYNSEYIKEYIKTYSKDEFVDKNKAEKDKIHENLSKNRFEEIMYVGSNYISTKVDVGNGNREEDSTYKMIPIDNPELEKGVNIDAILGEDGKKAFDDSFHISKKLLSEEEEENFRLVRPVYSNYTLVRRNGHWVLRGRVLGYNSAVQDFNIESLPPKNLVAYDNLYMSWNAIKDIQPTATDAYTSPNTRYCLIINKDEIFIYELLNGKINGKANEPIKRIKLNPGETVVMAEWASGEYVNKWNSMFLVN